MGYMFPNSGNDVQVKWTHFDHSTTDSIFTNSEDTKVYSALDGTISRGLSSTQNVTSASDVTFQYDAIDLDVGQYMAIGTRLTTRLFAGLRYADIRNDVTDTYTLLDSDVSDFSQVTTDSFNSEFTGIGPRIGIDTSYHISDCFGAVAHFATALLVGRVQSSSSETVVTTNPPDTNALATVTGPNSNYTTSNQTRVVPAFDAKLGLDYTIGFKNGTSNMVIEAGYQVTQYVDAIDRLYDGYTTTSSVGFNGPYLSLNFKI